MQKIKKIVNHLRSQPEETRTQILHTTMLVFAVILFITWTISFANRVSSSSESAKNNPNPISEFSNRITEDSGDISWPASVNYTDMDTGE